MINLFWRLVAKLLARPAVVAWLISRAQRTPYGLVQGQKRTENLLTYETGNR